jgi:hypothetical protein
MRIPILAYLVFGLASYCIASPLSTFVDLSLHFNNKAASSKVNGTGNFDLAGGSYVAGFLPSGIFTYRGVDVSHPSCRESTALNSTESSPFPLFITTLRLTTYASPLKSSRSRLEDTMRSTHCSLLRRTTLVRGTLLSIIRMEHRL